MSDDTPDDRIPEAGNRAVRRERFLRVAERRTRSVIERLRILGNCSHRGIYDYSTKDIDLIFAALQHELDQTRRRFDEKMKRRNVFKLE